MAIAGSVEFVATNRRVPNGRTVIGAGQSRASNRCGACKQNATFFQEKIRFHVFWLFWDTAQARDNDCSIKSCGTMDFGNREGDRQYNFQFKSPKPGNKNQQVVHSVL